MAVVAPRLATWEDLARLPRDVRAEVLAGEISTLPSPSSGHQELVADLSGALRPRFQRQRGGPGGWWILPDLDIALSAHDVVRPDLAGWRRERVPQRPERPVQDRPDWVCEVLSPSNEGYDRREKLGIYRRYGVPHYWIVSPAARTLEAYRLEGAFYLHLGTWVDEREARIPPFDAVPLDVADLFAVLDDPVPEGTPGG